MFEANVRSRPGFALRELLIAMVIAVTLLGVVSCGVQRVSEGANARTATMNNLSQCAKAVHLCQDQFGKYPPYFGTYGPKTTPFTFHVHLLPFVDQGPLYANPDAKSIVGYLSFHDGPHNNRKRRQRL